MSASTNSHNTNISNENILSNSDIPITNFTSIIEPTSSDDPISNNNIEDNNHIYDRIPQPPNPIVTKSSDDDDDDEITTITHSMNENIDWFSSKEYIIFKNQLTSLRNCNNFVLKE